MKAVVGDITKLRDIDVVVNAANGLGIMGKGVAGALAFSGGDLLKDAARQTGKEKGPFKAGTYYHTTSGLMQRRGIKEVYHAVTMERPGGFTSIDIVVKALETVLNNAIINGVRSIAIPALGTGVGGLDKYSVASRMARVAAEYDAHLEITVIDIDKEFIAHFKKIARIEDDNDNSIE